MGVVTKLRRYGEEVAFALRAGRSVRDKLRLATRTLQFHWANGGRPVGTDDPFTARVRLRTLDVDLRLRPMSGDLFIIFEILMDEVYAVPRARLDPAGVRYVIDCGANVGLSALYFADRYPAATVVAVEPHPDNFRLLSHNVAGVPRVRPVHAAVVGRPRDVVVLTTDRPAWGNAVTDSGAGVEVPAVTIARLMADHCISTIDLLKVDIEGAEREVFAVGEFLSATGFVVTELHGGYSLADFDRDVRPHGLAAHPPGAGLKTVYACPARGSARGE